MSAADVTGNMFPRFARPVFLKHFFETKPSPTFPLFLSEHACVV